MTRTEVIRLGTERLRTAGVESPRREARLLLGHSLGISQESLLADPGAPVDDNPFRALLDRRCAREPLAFITGRREFWSLEFEVSPSTLIPRPESETLIEAALAALPNLRRPVRVLDLGTGTGCLLLAVLSELPAAFGVGVDRTDAALGLARRNAARLGVADRTAFLCGDWTAALSGRFDLVVCNPPYVPSGDIAALMAEVAGYEPVAALDGGPDGLDAYRTLLPRLPGLLAEGGVAAVELGIGQARAVAGLADPTALAISWRMDLSGVSRAMMLRRGSRNPGGPATKKPFGGTRQGS